MDYSQKLEIVNPFAIASMLWVEEHQSEKDILLLGTQGGLKFTLMNEILDFSFGGGYFTYTNLKGSPLLVDESDSFGNSVDTNGYYSVDYDIVEIFTTLEAKVHGFPVTLEGDFVINTRADEEDTGYLVGVRFGKIKKAGDFSGRYIYREVEKDAVLGAYTDSDFIGGGSNGKGHEMGLDVGLAKKITSSATYFINKIGISNGKNFHRLQIDVAFKF